MIKRSGMFWIIAILSCIAAIFFFMNRGQKRQETAGFGMFSWDEGIMEEDEALKDCIEQAGISHIYQQFSKETLENGNASLFIKKFKKADISVYAAMGKPEWAYDADGKALVKEILRIADYNKDQSEYGRIAGVMIDVEPYLLDEWDEGDETRAELMEDYLSCMKSAYSCAVEKQLQFLVCIPVFYDRTNPDILEELISCTCDGIAVMNYDRTDEYGQIAKEVGFAREYDKEIICIYELQKAGKHDLEEINTYAEQGLEALWKSADRLERQFGYHKLRFAYHYYIPLRDMLLKDNTEFIRG